MLYFRDEIEEINFAAPATTFPKFSQLLDVDEYSYSILLGFTVSVGGLTESLVSSIINNLFLRKINLLSLPVSIIHFYMSWECVLTCLIKQLKIYLHYDW